MQRNKRILLYMGHPAHYHNFSVVMKQLAEEGCEVLLVAREKDVLSRLLQDTGFETIFLPARTGNSKSGLITSVLQREWRMLQIVRKFKPDIMAGTDLVIAHMGKLLGIPSVLINEDDLDQIPLFAKYGVRFCDAHLAPDVCRVAGYEHKTLHYRGYHELAYLHPDHFTPNPRILDNFIDVQKPYFILRFAKLTAHHDEGRKGISDELAGELIRKLNPHGSVFITSERPLSPQFEPYRIAIPPQHMHHALAFAQLYIGDSQTMAAEAAVLGTPSLRFNDFVGKLSYLDELENRYKLTVGIPTNEPQRLFQEVDRILSHTNTKGEFDQRRTKMLSEKENLAKLWTAFLLNYPHQQNIQGFFRKD